MKPVLVWTLAIFVCFGCGGEQPGAEGQPDPAGKPAGLTEAPKSTPERPIVILETDSGAIVMEFYPEVAPVTCDSILSLVNRGFYDSLTIHRIIRNGIIQGGDPKGNGTGNAGFTIPAEFSDRSHVKGAVSMARPEVDINGSSCQFFICLSALPSLDGEYNLFGQVIGGMEVAQKLGGVPTGPGDRPKEPVYILRMYENK